MRAVCRSILPLAISFGFAVAASTPAIVISDQVNARARPGAVGEVLTHLRRGELVHVLGEVTDPDAKSGEPKRWAKIEMPAFVPVWISADLVDAATMTVKRDGVNLRAGPGKSYSSVGAVPRGTKLNEISTEGEWIQVEAPAGTCAFVALKLLSNDAPPDRLVAKPAAPARSDPKWISVPEPAAPAPEGPVILPVPAEPAPLDSAPATTAATERPAEPAPVQAPIQSPSPLAPAAAAAEPATPPDAAEKGPARPTEARRVVTRLGMIKRSWNVKSPSRYSLRSLNPGEGELDLLWTDDPKLDLSSLVGRKALIKGEEYMDGEWRRTPLLKIESITTY